MPDATRALAPALTPEEWRARREHRAMVGPGCDVARDRLAIGHFMMAINNDDFPDGDPRKITRDKVAHLRSVLSEANKAKREHWSGWAQIEELCNALESLLPPEG